ncbi:hypothetical protein N7528_002904 [Penicillium herquei]|nr:hypothetical protein N7528_002904 [Penicillium herquei]
MPPRLSHRKSTTGCVRCKSRKVKCDEKRPVCSHCNRHNVACEYPSLTPRVYDPTQPKGSSAQGRRAIDVSKSEPPRGGLPVTELRLMHHWVTATAATMSSAQIPSVHEMWSVAIPEMAFDYEPLLHTLLAISAAHRTKLWPDQENNLRPIQHAYIDTALQDHLPMTANLDGNTSEAVCINAIMLSLYTLYLRSEPFSSQYEPPLLWLSVSRGVRTIMKTVFHQFVKSNSKLNPLLLAKPIIFNQGMSAFKSSTKPFHTILDYDRDKEDFDERTLRAYTESIEYIEGMYAAMQSNEPIWVLRKIFTGFPPMMPRRFGELVAEKRPRALVILAYLFALGKRTDDIWWLHGIPEREVRGINSILPIDWQWAMIWPLNLISDGSGAVASSVGFSLSN